MSKDYNKFCKNILKSNDDLYTKDSIQKNIEDLKKDIKIISHKIDRLYSMLVNLINEKEF